LAIRYITTRDGTALRAGVFQPENPAGRICVLLGGHAEYIEKYGEVIHELNTRGFTVATFDWRGQGGSARLLPDPLKGYVGDFADYDKDLQDFMRIAVAPLKGAKPMVLAHSMGGHIALRALHDKPGMFAAAVLTAPMLGIATHGYPAFVARGVTAMQALLGHGKDLAWGMKGHDPLTIDFAHQTVTSDRARFERNQKALRAQPNLRITGTCWGWIEAAYLSMEKLAEPGYAAAIKTPVLLFGAGHDRVVLVETDRQFAARLPHGRYAEIAGSEHEILMEKDAIRARFWTEFDKFIKEQAL